MCEMQKYLPPRFFNAQEHYLIHQVEEIELCGPVNSRNVDGGKEFEVIEVFC